MDNYATHKADKVQRWLDSHPRFCIHFTPTGASWINLVERFFGKITSEAIRRGSFRSTNQRKKAMDDYIQMDNEDPAPFKWTARSGREVWTGLPWVLGDIVWCVGLCQWRLLIGMGPAPGVV